MSAGSASRGTTLCTQYGLISYDGHYRLNPSINLELNAVVYNLHLLAKQRAAEVAGAAPGDAVKVPVMIASCLLNHAGECGGACKVVLEEEIGLTEFREEVRSYQLANNGRTGVAADIRVSRRIHVLPSLSASIRKGVSLGVIRLAAADHAHATSEWTMTTEGRPSFASALQDSVAPPPATATSVGASAVLPHAGGRPTMGGPAGGLGVGGAGGGAAGAAAPGAAAGSAVSTVALQATPAKSFLVRAVQAVPLGDGYRALFEQVG